ncbi:YdeI/OmpD-associated family protein [Enterococcus saccharolyticus]|uniref:Bacteriocin resistance YdeI/OmpD-like protein n=1 Tax=Candidatus Enterococcus willemsii TaxID=1857215 RepID=A0ABQ6Z2D6_9ENTE|nr:MULTISPECIES: YdeI/OmpD-associated family protein [Enterococcus]KAF1305765.1 hypothetical protein BAU17_00515 [Enterococcus sp. CU12B]MCD5001528.1 YdeI/OmpD-associated family protein [Enterococcus saccharolyticus]
MSEVLAKKLRLSLEEPIVVIHQPDTNYFSDFQVIEGFPKEPVSTVILFVKTLEEMKESVERLIATEAVAMNGRVLICYPKKGNKVLDTYVHRDDIFPALQVTSEGFIKGTDFKFNQMVKLDDTYTIVGMKRTAKKKAKTNETKIDYNDYRPQLEEALANEPEALSFFQQLAPGYQKKWLTYVYSAKRAATQEKRLAETTDLLKKKIKAKELMPK